MKEKEYIDLRGKVSEFLKSKKRNLYLGGHKNLYKFLMYLTFILAIQSFFALFQLQEASKAIKVSQLFQGLASLIFSIQFYIIQRSPPDDDLEREEWLWKNGHRVLTLGIAGALLFLPPLILRQELNTVNRIAAFWSCLNLILVSSITAFIAKNPKYFLNSFLTGFGTIVVIISPFILSFIWVKKAQPHSFWHVAGALIIGTAFSYSWYIYKQNIKDGKFNLIQNSVLRFLKPHYIIDALPISIKLALKSERKALNIIEKLTKNEEYEVEMLLLEKLQNKYNKKSLTNGYLGGIIAFIILAIISALIEFITQDELYNPYIKDLIIKFKELW